MKFTNRSGLPDALLRAISNDPYDKGDAEFSVTELLKPPRQAALQKAHAHELTEDAEERLWSLYGQIVHTILERANVNAIAEKRYFGMIGDAKVSGQVDTLDLDGGVLSDWKFTTSWGFKPGREAKPEWVAQLNMQLELLRQNGHEAKTLQIIGLLRDHSKLEAARKPDEYPALPVVTLPIPLWEREKTIAFMKERVVLHRQASKELPECSDEDRWAKAPKFALMKKNQKKAVKLYDRKSDADAHASTNPALLFVQTRPGEQTRCQFYCGAKAFCEQFKQLQQTKPVQAEDESEAV